MSSDVGTSKAGGWSPGVGDPGVCVHHGGHCYLTSRERAGIFLRRVQWLCTHGRGELVPLVHDGGVDLLYITSNVPLQVHDVRDQSFRRSHPDPPTR